MLCVLYYQTLLPLSKVQDALKRIEVIVLSVNNRFPEKRLNVIPWTHRCIKDEEQVEQSNLSHERHYSWLLWDHMGG